MTAERFAECCCEAQRLANVSRASLARDPLGWRRMTTAARRLRSLRCLTRRNGGGDPQTDPA